VLSKVAGKCQVYQESGIAAMVAQILLDHPSAAAAVHGDTAVAWGRRCADAGTRRRVRNNGMKLETHVMARAREQNAKEEREIKNSSISAQPPTDLEKS